MSGRSYPKPWRAPVCKVVECHDARRKNCPHAAITAAVPLCVSNSTLKSVVARDRAIVWRLAVRQIEQRFIHITPSPPLRRIIALDDRMPGGVKMLGRVLVGRVVAAADM